MGLAGGFGAGKGGEYRTQPSGRLCPSLRAPTLRSVMLSWPGEAEAAQFSKSLQKVWQQTEAELELPSCSLALLADNDLLVLMPANKSRR